MKWDLKRLERAFKAYDVRGRVPEDLDPELAESIGCAYAKLFSPQKVAVGYDIRLSSAAISQALMKGLTASGVEVWDLGLCGTEQVYFATFFYQLDGGIMVTASHNPPNHNGMKCVRERAIPINEDTGLRQMAQLIAEAGFVKSPRPGAVVKRSFMADYVRHLIGLIDPQAMKPLRVVCNAGNGVAGETLDKLAQHLPLQFVRLLHEPDGHFPHGVPNPMLPENRELTARTVREEGADFGVAWDGDFDRCFFYDEKGEFIDGYYMVGLFAEYFLAKKPGAKVIYDPRLTWNTREVVANRQGVALQNKSGHAFMKQRMRDEDAIYGGETSAHHYFRDFGYCDSGMIPWLVLAEILSRTDKPFSQVIGERMRAFPVSGEINRKVEDARSVMKKVRAAYEKQALVADTMDGISLEFKDWRFNLRMSNTEPLIRLNVETRGDAELLAEKTQELLAYVGGTP